MDKEKAYALFKNVLDSFYDSEMMVIDERSTSPKDIDELEQNVKELDEEMRKYLDIGVPLMTSPSFGIPPTPRCIAT